MPNSAKKPYRTLAALACTLAIGLATYSLWPASSELGNVQHAAYPAEAGGRYVLAHVPAGPVFLLDRGY